MGRLGQTIGLDSAISLLLPNSLPVRIDDIASPMVEIK